MYWLGLLGVFTVILLQVYIALKLRDRFRDIDRRFEKNDSGFLKISSTIDTAIDDVNDKYLDIQNTVALSSIDFNYPVSFGGWSIDGFLAKRITQILLESPPKLILEIGSGSSTILIEKCTRQLGYTPEHIAIDHEKRYLKLTERLALANSPDNTIEFHQCNLGEIQAHDGPWYLGLPEIIGSRKIDLLIIDGPPETTHPRARYPALPILHDHLSQNCIVILDDASRDDEKAIIKKWLSMYPSFELEIIHEGHGVAILTRCENPS